mmetsp:Transcript_29072/g.64193  ORF Transcript_29072/g.64193 Transcript_29072/m.64193 type:complete len:233 (+) Transcript_29072:3138-3836(+)
MLLVDCGHHLGPAAPRSCQQLLVRLAQGLRHRVQGQHCGTHGGAQGGQGLLGVWAYGLALRHHKAFNAGALPLVMRVGAGQVQAAGRRALRHQLLQLLQRPAGGPATECELVQGLTAGLSPGGAGQKPGVIEGQALLQAEVEELVPGQENWAACEGVKGVGAGGDQVLPCRQLAVMAVTACHHLKAEGHAPGGQHRHESGQLLLSCRLVTSAAPLVMRMQQHSSTRCELIVE